MAPTWLLVLAWVTLGLALVSAGAVIYDINGRGWRQRMRVMETRRHSE